MLKSMFIYLFLILLVLQGCKTSRVHETTLSVEWELANRALLNPAQSLENGNCENPLTAITFKKLLVFLDQEKLALKRLDAVKKALEQSCMTSYQLSRIIILFELETHKLDIAKAAYPAVFDPQNYYWVSKQLRLKSSQEELEKVIAETDLD